MMLAALSATAAWFVFITLSSAVIGNGPSETVAQSKRGMSKQVQRWEVAEFDFKTDLVPADPFEVDFGAVFQHPEGELQRVPGFYNGEADWRLRFCPEKTGQWEFTTYSSLPELTGRKGKINVVSNSREWQKGPIQISPKNRQRFQYADGSPYFVMAFELDWLFALDAENADGTPLAHELASTVADYGFNQVVMNVYAYDATWGEKTKIAPDHNFAKPTVFPFGGTNEEPDFSTLNVTFFQRLDRVIELLNERQVVAHLMIYVWNKQVNWPAPESGADNRYFDYVIKRYQAYPNLIWDISKEALDYGRDDMGYITRRIDRLKRIDAHNRLVTVHDYKYCDAFPGKVDFISIQEWQPYLYHRMVEVGEEHRRQPVFNIEHGGYEKTIYSIFDGAYTDPITCLDRSYQCIFAGTYPTYYWQNTSWYNVITRPFELPKEQQPHFRYYKYLTDLFQSVDFNELSPVQETFSPPFLTNGDDVYLFYLPGYRRGINGRLPELLGKRMRIRWFDPLTGEYTGEMEHHFKDDTWLWFKRPEEITGPMTIAVFNEIN
ncbi:MAG: DUF5060 domain-containing protein [Planctomycetota bacterium]